MEFGPCCRVLTPEQLRDCYEQADKSSAIARVALCSLCGKFGRGTACAFSDVTRRVDAFACFDCMSREPCPRL